MEHGTEPWLMAWWVDLVPSDMGKVWQWHYTTWSESPWSVWNSVAISHFLFYVYLAPSCWQSWTPFQRLMLTNLNWSGQFFLDSPNLTLLPSLLFTHLCLVGSDDATHHCHIPLGGGKSADSVQILEANSVCFPITVSLVRKSIQYVSRLTLGLQSTRSSIPVLVKHMVKKQRKGLFSRLGRWWGQNRSFFLFFSPFFRQISRTGSARVGRV